MAGTKGEEAIVEGHKELGGRKRVDGNKDARPAKREKVEGNKAADCRNLGDKEEGEAVGDGTEGGGEEEELKKEEVDRLCRLLEDYPKKLTNRDVEDVIRYFDVDKIISLASKSDQGNGLSDYWYLEKDSYVPSHGKVLGLLMLLCGGIEKLEEVDLFILYQNFPRLSFAQLLLSALVSFTKRFRRGGALFDKADEWVMISRLCCALPWKLFTHIMYHMTSLPQFKRSEKEEEDLDEERTSVQKKAAESCEICYGKGKHSGFNGYHCSFWYSVPSGLTVGPSHRVLCRGCSFAISNTDSNVFFGCCFCGSRRGQAEPRSELWDV